MHKQLSEAHHKQLTEGSGIKEDVIKARGYYTEESSRRLGIMGFSSTQRRVPALVLPLYRPFDDRPYVFQIRPDKPRVDAKGRTLKYEYPAGTRPILDCPPTTFMKKALKSKDALFITEGSKKADAAVSKGIPCLALSGVWSWKYKDKQGVRSIIPEVDEIDFKDRTVNLCFDNDLMEKEQIYWALVRLSGILQSRGARVRYAIIPPGPAKGLDDFLNQKGVKKDDVERLVVDVLPEPPCMRYTFDDKGMAERISDVLADQMFFDNRNNMWYVWNGHLWVQDKPGSFAINHISDELQVLREEARGLSNDAAGGAKKSPREAMYLLASRYGDYNRIKGVEALAKARMAEADPDLDKQPDLLCCQNGTLDLFNREFREHRSEDRVTKMANVSYDPMAECPKWEEFMEGRFPNEETRSFIQRMCGLFLTGNSPEKAFFILQGEKDCGKSVFIELIHWLLGDYGAKVDKATLTKGKGGDNGKQLEKAAELVGRRYIYVDESSSKDEIDDAFIKEVTGGESTLKYRYLYQQAGEARAEFTLVLATNFKPRMVGNDTAIWRRCKLVHFGESIPEADQIGNFQRVLREEGPGILNWMYAGYCDWADRGLRAPEEVDNWTAHYRDENDPVGQFMRENYDIGADIDGFVSSNELYMHYTQWALENEIPIKTLGDKALFSRHVKQRWPVTKDGPRSSTQRGFHHLVVHSPWRGEGLNDEELMEV